MWIIFGVISILFCVAGWGLAAKKKSISIWMAACSLSFVSITLLMEYRMVLRWVYKEDWIALMDVVPSTFSMMTGYVVIMLMANTISIIAWMRQTRQEGLAWKDC